jgi:GNAT superfamily N-acetyltransferase
MRVRRARPKDVEVVLAVLTNAAAWLRAQGIEQWPDRFPVEWVMPAIDRGETWLAEVDGETVGTLVVQWDDPIFWAGFPSDAGYLHRLAVRRHGGGVGGRILRWAERHAAVNERAFLRLDCVSWNQSLCAYYERAGYEHVSHVTVGEYRQARYEKPVR